MPLSSGCCSKRGCIKRGAQNAGSPKGDPDRRQIRRKASKRAQSRTIAKSRFAPPFPYCRRIRVDRNDRKGGAAKGGTAKIRSWTCVRRNGVCGARAQGPPVYLMETRHSDAYPNWSGYVSDLGSSPASAEPQNPETPKRLKKGGSFLLTVGAFLLTVKLLCLQLTFYSLVDTFSLCKQKSSDCK